MIRPFRVLAGAALLLGCAALPRPAAAQPVVGFVEDFPTTTTTWGGGAVFTNPLGGGWGGPGDGFLRVETFAPGNLGAVSMGPEYAGDWLAAGVRSISIRLNDLGSAEPLSLHWGIGNGANFWQYDVGFTPGPSAWSEFVVDLEDSSAWTLIIGSGSFAGALQNTDRVRIRHDLPAFVQTPDPVQGAFGLDHVVLRGASVGVPGAPRAAGPVTLAPPYPNPARGPVTFAFTAPGPGAVAIEVFDALGRRVREARVEVPAAGPHTWLWDGRDAAGARAPAGVYRVRARGPAGGTVRTFVRTE